MKITGIIKAIQQGQVQITDHADEEAEDDDLGFEEIFFATCGGEIIETYPTEKPYPRCLIFGEDPSGKAVHSVWTYDQKTGIAVLITVYRPDPRRWIDWRIRR
ncbi:DUF4258 domain-containing protein (plasmid) [Acaryochloris marina S15]|nr:DUF4258 domain-containing protein [Acaryochloris marina S15]